MMATTTPRPAIEALDVPAEQVAADTKRLRLQAGQMAEQQHVTDVDDTAYARLADNFGDKVSTDADYPEWPLGGAR